MKTLVISILGKDKAGIVDSLAATVVKHQGNWLASSLTELAGQFAGILHIEVPTEQSAALIQALKSIDDLMVHVSEGEAPSDATEVMPIIITANDRAGIVSEVSQALNELAVNILEISTEVESAPNWGGEIFTAVIAIETQPESELQSIQTKLESLADDLIVDFGE